MKEPSQAGSQKLQLAEDQVTGKRSTEVFDLPYLNVFVKFILLNKVNGFLSLKYSKDRKSVV